jgi:hypothetical protein
MRTRTLPLLLLFSLACASAIIAMARGHRSTRPEDCIQYNPYALQIEDIGDKGWRLRDGTMWLQVLDNRDDAEAALVLAQQHNYQCFIGRNNRRPDRIHYILQYWK